VFVVLGVTLAMLLSKDSAVVSAGFACFVVGLGLGLAASPTVIAGQSVVGWDRRGVVTATNMFCRSLGSAVGAAVFGAVANGTLAGRPETRDPLFEATHNVFLALAVAAVVIVGALAVLPRRTERLTFG
jgi:hypothetical protein